MIARHAALIGIGFCLGIALWPPSTCAQMRSMPAAVAVPDSRWPSGPVIGTAIPAEAITDDVTLDDGTVAALPELAGIETVVDAEYWTWQISPSGLLYPAYLASGKQSRFASQWVFEKDRGWLWDVTLGGYVGLLRYGTANALFPEGWQIDLEGAAFPRLALEEQCDLVSADFRVGVPLTYRRGPWETKLGYYHISSHLGDEFMRRHPEVLRINYSREAIVLGLAVRPLPALRLYSEAGWGFDVDGGSRPWEFQFGADLSSPEPSAPFGAPFFAVNGRIREEVDYGGNFTVQAGWQWRGETGRLLRFGAHYFNGKSDQYEFFREHEELIGIGLWYDY